MPRLTLLLTSVLLGCAAAPERIPESWVGKGEADARNAYAASSIDAGVVYWGGSSLLGRAPNPWRIPESWVGKGEADVRNAYAASATDAGVVYWGGSGRRRLYLALGDGTQVWFDLDRDGVVELAGGPEPRTRWVRYNGDSITVEESP